MRLPFLEKTDGSASFLRAARAGNLEKVLEFLKTNTDINTCNANGLNALHLASKEGHVNVVRELLQRGANVDAATKKGNTALHIASLAGQEEIVKVLVQHQALVNIQSQNGFTPLYMAAQENHDSVVRFLLANSANQSLATEDGFTPLAVALQQGHDKVVAVLLENDTRGKVRLPALHIAAKKDDTKAAALLLHTDHNPDVTSKSGFTPLHIAAHYGNENIANLLIQRGADVNYIAKHQITPLHVASKWGKGNMVSLLIDKGANYEAKTRDGLTPLHCAARSGHETVVDMLLEKGAPITSKTKNGLAPLHMASQGDHVNAARILLYHKAPVDDVTVDYLTALHVAAHCGHVRVAKLLLDRKADANARALNGFTPLHIACKKNRIKVVELLLKHGASIEATTESGLTPLHVASFMGCMNIVIYLIQHGASADVPTVRGETPLHLAARANQTDIIRILLRNGAHVDARAREQQTALHIASRLGNSDIVVLLLQHGAAVDATTKDHYTALHIAAKEGQEEVASVLLEHGASLTSTTKKGFTPLHLAAKYGNMKVARLLLQKDAPVDAQGKNGVTPLHVAAHYDHQNVALLLLDKGASPHATAKNGYTPLHIAARKNQMDIATTLLEYGASANAESKAGFTPLHLSSQEGHTDMATLLIEHNAAAGACAKNGLTPLHLCAQEDRVNVAAILVKHGAQIDPSTKAGYTPLHVACHFGQMNMVRFLLQHGAKVDSTTQLGYTPLHQAAQQGHTQIVNLLLENKAEPNTETNDGKTALSIAQRLGYISVVETLKIVTETTINTTTTTVTEEKYKVVVPETMHETFMSESEDEGGDDTMLGDQSYRYLTVDEMKSLGDDSLPIDVTKDEKMDVSFINNSMAAPPVAPADQLSPQHLKEQQYAQFTAHYPSDNVDVAKTPILAGPESLNTTLNTTVDSAMIETQIEPQIIHTKLAPQLSAQMNQESVQHIPLKQIPVQNKTDQASQGHIICDQVTSVTEKAAEILNGWEGFLVSFMVDARGGAMRGCRHSGVRVIIPPRKAAMPMRVTCRYLKKDKLVHAPPLMEGEALASRILEMGPAGAKFLGPVIIEVPHFASLRGKEREIVILRSDNGETWREHTLEATEEAVQEVLNESFDGEELKQLEDLNTNRITRILTTDFPQYFAIVTRIRQEVHAIGPEGGMVSSTVVPQVQAVFPQGALTKKIKVGLQAQPIPTDLVAKLLGNRVAVSPIVTVEPRRRKFHKPITLTIPVPQASSKGMINQYSGEAPTLRLLCSITGGTTRAQWEDVTGSTPLTHVNDCVSFTTTVSARFWLMDCSNIPEATKMATELYREAIHVPFMAKFVVFSKRHQLEEARVRVFCMTDDREDKTLEQQELFVEVAKSRDVEVLEGKPQFLEFAGNLVPVTKSGDQLAFNFYAFRENRLPFTVRVKDQHADPIGRVAFMRQPKVGRGDPPQTPICNLNIALPDNIQPEPAPSEPDLLALEKKYSFLSISKADTIHKADLRLTDISNMLGTDWVALAHELEISDSDINIIKSQYPDNAPQQAIVMLRLWMQTSGNKANGNTLEKGLRKIGRDDIVNQCIFNVELVTDDIERAMAKAHLDQSGFEAFRDELGPSRDATLNRDVSLDVSYDEQDMMKEAESAEEEEENQRAYQDKSSREERTVDMSPTYESEEKKYAGEEKVVTEEKVTKEKDRDGSAITISTTSATVKKEPSEETKLDEFIKEKVVSEPFQETKADSIIKESLASEDMKIEPVVTEHVVSQPVHETISIREDILKAEPQTLLEKNEKPFIVAEAEESILDKEEEQLIEQSELEKTVVKVVEKPTEIIEEVLERKESEAPKVLHTIQMDEPQEIHTKTVSEIVSRQDGTPMSVTTTETKSYTTAEDGTIEEHIVVQKQTSRAVDGTDMGEDKSFILQKIGEELGRLDEKLEEKFKEKRKTDEPEVAQEEVREEEVVAMRREGPAQPTSQVVVEYSSLPTTLSSTTTITTTTSSIAPIPDVFTQTSVESTQMSSARGTAEVSFPDTSVTTGDEASMHVQEASIQQAAPQIVDRRIAHQDPHQQEVSLHQCSHQKQPQDKNAATDGDSHKSGQTEERGCSPITVLEARREIEQVTVRPLSRSSSHTISTTTSWGAPVSSTTSIQLSDNESAHCVQLTLHSESCVTLLAPKEMWQELGHVSQQQEQEQQEQQQDIHQTKSRGEEYSEDDPTEIAVTSESKHQSKEDMCWPQQGTPIKHVDFKSEKICDIKKRNDDTNDVNDARIPTDQECAKSKETSAETLTVPRHEIWDPSNRDFIELKGVMDQTNIEMLNSVQKHSDGEKDMTSEHTSSLCKEEAVEDSLLQKDMSEAVMSRKETEEKTLVSVLSENEATEIMQSSSRDLAKAMYEIPAAVNEDPVHMASEVIAPSTHRPTTLMITSNSNESTDDAECTANDPTRDDRENDVPQELKQEGSTAVMEEFKQQGVVIPQSLVMSEHLSGNESGAVPRVERSMRPAPRTTTLVKVKVEKRPVGSHPQARERILHEHQAIVHAPSVEEEVRGLMQEVKEATSQIKQEVKELRQADTPTPDTPTPLREFKEFLNREEEQEQERLPTIKEMCRESEEDASVSMGGEHMHGNEHLHLRLNVPVQECSTPLQVVQPGFDYSIHPDSGYSTLEGYNAVSVNPSQTAKYTPFFTEMVPEGFSNELSVKSELESPLSPVVSSNFCPVVNVGSAISQDSEKHGRSRFKSLLTKVYKSASKGLHKSESRKGDGLGEKLSVRNSVKDIVDINRCRLASWETSGIVRNKDEGIQSPSYEFAVQKNATEKKSSECQEKKWQKNGNEFYTHIVKELIKTPVTNIRNSHMKDIQTVKVGVSQSPVSESQAHITQSRHLEMPHMETSHTDSSLLEQPLTKVLNTEPSVTEIPNTKHSALKVTDTLSTTQSNTNMVFTVSSVLESQGEHELFDLGKRIDKENFSASSCAVNLGMPGKIVSGHDDVLTSNILENRSSTNEMLVTELVPAESSRSEIRKNTSELADMLTLKSSSGYPVTQSLPKSLPSESLITGSCILNTVTESKADNIQESIKSKIEENYEPNKSELNLTPLDPYLFQVATTDISANSDFKAKVNPNDAYLVMTSDAGASMEKKGQPSFMQQDLHKVLSAGAVKPSSLEMYEEDYVERHHTDVVDVLETLIELDETEDEDGLSQEEQEIHLNTEVSKEIKHTEEQQPEKYEIESENLSKIDIIRIEQPDSQFRRAHVESDTGAHIDEVQILSKTNVDTVTEGVTSVEKSRSDAQLFLEDELSVIPRKSDVVETAVMEEVDSKAEVILEGEKITKESEELDEENTSCQYDITKGLSKKVGLGDNNEIGEIGYVFSYKTSYKDTQIDEGVDMEGMPLSQEKSIKGTKVIEEADEPRSFDITALTLDTSPTYFAKLLHRTAPVNESPGEGSLVSTAIHNQMKEQGDIVETVHTAEEVLVKGTSMTYRIDELGDFDTAEITKSISSHTNVVAKQSQGNIHEEKPGEEGICSSTFEQKHNKAQSSIKETAHAEVTSEEVWKEFSSGSETDMGEELLKVFSDVNESQTHIAKMLHAPDIGNEGCNSSKDRLQMIEEIDKMEATQHNDSGFFKKEIFVCKPKIKASELQCNAEKYVNTTSQNVLSADSDLLKRLQFANEVSQIEEFIEVGEAELPSLEIALVKTIEKAHWLEVPEKACAVTLTKQVWHESGPDSLKDTLTVAEIYQPQESIQLENSNKVKDDNCSLHGEHTNKSEMGLKSSEPDISVSISEREGSDGWIEKTIACQALVIEYPEIEEPTSKGEDSLKEEQIKLDARDSEEGQEYMLPVIESLSRTLSETDEIKMSKTMDVELSPSSDTGLLLAMKTTKPLKGIEAGIYDLDEKFYDGGKSKALFGKPEPVQVQELSSTLGNEKQWSSKVNVRQLKTSTEFHNLDTIDKIFSHTSLCDEEQKNYKILPVAEKHLPEDSFVIMDTGSDSDRKENTESVDPFVVGEMVRSEQMLKVKYGDTAASKTELELCDRFMQDSKWEEVLPVGNSEIGVIVEEANSPLNLQRSDDLHQVMVINSETFEVVQAQQSYTLKPDDLWVEYNEGLEKQAGEVVRDGRLQCILKDETSKIFLDVTENIKPSCEVSSCEVDVRKELKDKKDLAAENNSENEIISKLDHVSEELKIVISSLEHNLVAGTSTDVRVVSILERLEQMEQDVVNLTTTSKACESSSPVLLPDVQTDYVVSTSQASPSTEQDLVHTEKINLGDLTYNKLKMPVGLGKDTSSLSLPHRQNPSGEVNGDDVQEALTDVEDIFSDGDQSPLIKRKSLLLASQQDMGGITDIEDMDLSGEEDDIIQEKKDMPTIQDLGLLPEPVKEIVSLTEGYAREASPLLLSDSEPESEDVQGRHKKNIMRVDKANQLDLPTDDISEGLTDVEDVVASGDEEIAPTEIEDLLPDHYLDQSDGVSDKEKIKAIPPTPKILLTKDRDSSDDEKESHRHQRHKSKESLKVESHEGGTTDVEDLVMSDKGESKEKLGSDKVESKDKIRRKKQVRRKTVPKKSVSKTLGASVGDSSYLTDVEILTGDEDQEALEDDYSVLAVPELDASLLTDSEDLEVSDTEVDNLIAKPVDKIVPSSVPEPLRERIKISEVEEVAQEESGCETDEEGFELNEKEDEKPLIPRKKVIHEPFDTNIKEALEVDESCEAVYTDTEDFDIDDKEEEEVMADIASRIPKESDIYTITEMESHIGQVTKRETIKDIHAELKQQIKEAELAGLTLQEALSDNALTDVEDLEDSGEFGETEVKMDSVVKPRSEEVLTDEESVSESDFEEEVSEPEKPVKRLPLVPQISEVRFVETEKGPLSIIITPDSVENNPNQMLKDQVSNVVFLESEEKEDFATDIEELSDGEERKTAPRLKTSYKQEPVTDTEDFDMDPSEVYRPLSPLPPNIRYNVLPSPKRELIHIKEDKYGVPQVTVRKMEKDELLVSDIEDLVVTDTEDIEVTEEEALRLGGVTDDATSDFELPDTGTTEVSTKMTHKKQSLQVDPEEDGGSTDVEELPLTRKPRRRAKNQSKLMSNVHGEDSHTDIELLSDQDDKGKLTVRVASPGGHTDMEDFETSETEDLEAPTHEDAPTPDIIRDAAIRKMIILKEGPHGTTYTEDAHVAPARINLLGVEGESGALTDVEDVEVSGAEDDVIPDHPAVNLPEYEASSVDISEKTSIPSDSNEAKHVKDNLLLPEDNFNNLTDVESLGEGEGTHEAGQLTEQQTQPVSHEQASSGHPTSVNKAGSDGGLHGGCPEAQGMDWEGKSVDSMYTETVVQARLSMLPAVDTSEGVAPTSFSSSSFPPGAIPLSSTSLSPTNIQPQAQTFQDLAEQPTQTCLNLEPSYLHDSNSLEPQGFDISPSSATKLSDPLFIEKGFVSGAEATASHLVASPSIASLQSESVAPFTGTDEVAAGSVTFNTSSAFISIGPISPTENSSEDHAEIDRTSTELSPDSVRFEQDILDTRTEDEAPDLDDDLFPASPVLGPELSERIFSVEGTEDTDITTPMEMRDSHTERDASASNLEFVDDKEVIDGKADLFKESLLGEDKKDEGSTYLLQETKEIEYKINRLQEQVQSQEIDPTAARSECKIILNAVEDIREAVGDGRIEMNSAVNTVTQDILSNIISISETIAQIMQKLHQTDPEHADLWSKDQTKEARITESTIVETGSAEDGSPSDAIVHDQSFSDLLDSDELNCDSLEDEFDQLAANLTMSPKAEAIVEVSPKATSIAVLTDVLSSPVSSIVYPSKPPDTLQATQREPAEGGTSSQQAVESETDAVVYDEMHQTDGDAELLDEFVETNCLLPEVNSENGKSSKSFSSMNNKRADELDESDEAYKTQSSVGTSNTDGKASSSQPAHETVENVVVLRESSRSGPRPTTFPLCLLQPEVVSSSPEAHQYFRQQQEVLEEMGHQGHLQMDVTDLRELMLPESLAESNKSEDNEGEEVKNAVREKCHKLIKSSSSYENLYDGADLRAAGSDDTPSTLQLTSSLGDPFTTKTQLPPEMCSSFENLYMKAKETDEIIHEADLLAVEILEEAVQEAAQEGQVQSTTLGVTASPFTSSTEFSVQDVVQPDSGAGAQQAPGLGVDEISSVMETFTSDGSDPLTTTHITRYDPDPITTTTTRTTRIIRRTQVEDGEVKEEIQEEYEGGH